MHHWQYDHVAPPRQNIVLLEDPDLFAYNEPEPTRLPRTTSRYTSATTSSHPSQPSSQYYQNLTPDPSKPPAPPSSVGTGASGYGAFRAGGPVNLFSRTYISFLINWLLIGFFNGAMPALVYPLFQVYLHLQAYQGNAVLALIDFAWNFKFIFSFLTDCVPMNRYRRKPYLYIGWFVLTACLMGFTFRPQVEPYMRDGAVVNNDAEWQGPRHVIPLIVMSFARILVIVASEGLMVEFAHREGAMDRGETQAITMMARGVGQVLGILLVAFGANSEEFGGTFNSALSLRAMFGIWIALAFLGLVTTRFIPEDQVPSSSQPFTSQLHRVWRIVQQRAVWQVMVFGFFLNAVLTLNYGEKNTLYQMRLTEHTLGLNILDAIKVVGSVIAAFLIYRFMLNANWRKIVVWSLMVVTVVGTPIDSITIFDLLPSVALFYIKDFVVSIPTALIVFMREFVIVEITSPGYEAVTFGFITTVHYLGTPLAMMVTNLFAMDREEVQNDTSEVRWHLAVELWIVIAVRVVVVVAIVNILPRDKRHALERKLLGNPNMVVPILIFLCVVAVFCVVVSSSFLAVIKNTSCLKFAGGSGCT